VRVKYQKKAKIDEQKRMVTMLSSREKQLMANISGNRAYDNLSLLVTPQERVSGSEAEAEGARKIRDLFSPYVDSCELEGVAVTGYLRGLGRLEVTSPIHASFPCQVNPVAASAKGEGILIDVSDGTKGGYEKAEIEVKGGVALVTIEKSMGGVGLMGLAREAKYQGTACLVYSITEKREDLVSVQVVDADIPVLSISRQSAAELRRLLSQHKEVRISFESNLTKIPGTSYNVVGTIRGSQFPQEVIYVTSHHDTFFHGTNDNNSTTACLLELANNLVKLRPKRTVRFIIHGSEEMGTEIGSEYIHYFRGSYGYTELHRSEMEDKEVGDIPFCVINGECLGSNPITPIQCTPELIRFVKETVADLEGEYEVNDPLWGGMWMGSDHLCYHTLGLPSICLMGAMNSDSSYFRRYHTEKDDPEHISVAALESNARLFTLLVARFDAAEVLPHSLKGLIETASRGMSLVPNRKRIKDLLEEKRAYCEELLSNEKKLKVTLELARVINKNIYGFAEGIFVNKFASINDTVAKLKEAHRLIDAEGDIEGAHNMLLSIPGLYQKENLSQEVSEELDSMRKTSLFLNRLSQFSLNIAPIFGQITRCEPKKAILRNLESLIEQSLETAKAWGITFEQSLANL
jgi:Iap family predicted aminopeptidase